MASIVTFLVWGVLQAARDAPAVDEGTDLASGITALVRRDLSLTPEHPPLGNLLAALPALAARPIVPDGPAYRSGDWFDHTADFIEANQEAGRLRRTLLLARSVPLLEAVGCALLIAHLGRRLGLRAGGLLAATLWLTTPVVVGLAHFAMIDVPFTLAVLLVSSALLRFRREPSTTSSVLVGLACAATLLTRHAGIVFVGVAVVVVVVTCWPRRRHAVRAAGTLLLVAWLGLLLGYRAFDPVPRDGPVRERLEGIVASAEAESPAVAAVLAVPAPLEWRAGLGYLSLTSEARSSFLFGQSWEGSRWWFFPGSVLVKVPLGALLLLVLGSLGWRRAAPDHSRSASLVLGLPAGALLVALVAQPLNTGVRLALPALALWFAAAAPAAVLLRHSAGKAVVGAILLTQVLAMVAAGPHALAWNPPPFQPPYRWASDSNVDVGQDMFRLERWSEGEAPYVSMISTRGLRRPPGSRELVGVDPSDVTGPVAVGVTSLTISHREELSWLRAYCPVGTIGDSILLYRFEEPPDGRPGPDRPVPPCDGEVSTRTG